MTTETRKNIALATCFGAGLPSAFLSFMLFVSAMGSIAYLFGAELDRPIVFAVAAFLGLAFLGAETLLHLHPNAKKYTIRIGIALVMMAAINLGAGQYRASDAVRVASDNAKQLAASDPRFVSNLESIRYQEQHVLNDGFAGNDTEANKAIASYKADNEKIVQEYVSNSHVAKNSSVFRFLFVLAFIFINVVYGFSLKQYEHYSGGAPTLPDNPASMTREQKAQFVKANTSMSNAQLAAQLNCSVSTVRNLRKLAHSCAKPRKWAGNGLVLSATGNQAKATHKQKRIEKLRKYLQGNPDASAKEMAKAIGVSSTETVRKYLAEMGEGKPADKFKFSAN